MITIGSTNIVTLTGLYDSVTSSYLNTATVTGELLTSSGTSVTTFVLSYLTASDGNYRGVLSAATTAVLTPGGAYQIQITATDSGNTGFFVSLELAEYKQV